MKPLTYSESSTTKTPLAQDANRSISHGSRNGSAPRVLRVAVASSGLGHIARGVETWAADLAAHLKSSPALDAVNSQHEGSVRVEAHLFGNAGPHSAFDQRVLNGRRRFDAETARIVARFRRLGGWRYGFGDGYQTEQTDFARRLWPLVRRDFDILHVQDPWLALVMHRLKRLGLSRPRVILAHGTEEDAAFLQKLDWLQQLAPCYLEDWETHRPARQSVFAVPNFVDTARFRPGDATEKAAARNAFGLPQDALIIFCAAAIKKHHKRVDWLIDEFGLFAASQKRPVLLVVAGGREAESDAVIAQGKAVLGERVRFLEGVGRERMPELYRAADVFALASLHEMMPIAVLEALASGLPVVCSDTPVLCWMTGAGGRRADLSRSGALAEQLQNLTEASERERGFRAARRQAESLFSPAAVIPQYLAMYGSVGNGIRVQRTYPAG